MKEKQIVGVFFAIGILIALIGASLMFFSIAPVPLRITIVILGISLIALSNPFAKSKNI